MVLMDHAYFQVTIKGLLFDGDKLLVLETPDGYVDFPGGRIDQSELELSWADCLRREVAEELGGAVEFTVGRPVFAAKRRYSPQYGSIRNVIAIYLECRYQGGEITLSDEHGRYDWLSPAELLATDRQFISEDEKAQLQAYFAKAASQPATD